jgi:myo-inositol 2-dehydrogenase/D-chiro-inositol 1-dehydrogenase
MKKIKVGLTGLGRIGKVHLKSLVHRLPEVEVLAVSDPVPETKEVAATFGIPTFYDDFQDVVNHPGIDAVILCSPTPTHLEYIEIAAKAGKDIFCEKPLDMTVAKIQAIDEIVRKHGVKLQVGFNRRFDADFAAVKNKVASGQIGDPHLLRLTSRDPAPPPIGYIKSSGGLFLDMTIHDFDMARFIVGSEVTEVYAQGAVLVDENIGKAGDIDTAIIQLKFENGAIGAIDNSRKSVYGYDQRVEIFGSGGMSLNANHYPDTSMRFDEAGRHGPPALHFFVERYAEAYFSEMKAFVEAVMTNKPVPVGSFDALMATKIAVAAQISVKENRPVPIAEIV